MDNQERIFGVHILLSVDPNGVLRGEAEQGIASLWFDSEKYTASGLPLDIPQRHSLFQHGWFLGVGRWCIFVTG